MAATVEDYLKSWKEEDTFETINENPELLANSRVSASVAGFLAKNPEILANNPEILANNPEILANNQELMLSALGTMDRGQVDQFVRRLQELIGSDDNEAGTE